MFRNIARFNQNKLTKKNNQKNFASLSSGSKSPKTITEALSNKFKHLKELEKNLDSDKEEEWEDEAEE